MSMARHLNDSDLVKEEFKKPKVDPIIIIGMHRSGTTMLSKLLRMAGFNMGWLTGKDTDESIFFQAINRSVFRYSHSFWDQPEAIDALLENETTLSAITQAVHDLCDSRKTFSYLGFSRNGSSLMTNEEKWGWKDPRNSYTLPIWLKLFPNSKVIFIYRNGIDVANSLHVRNLKLTAGHAFSARCTKIDGAFSLWEDYNERCLRNLESIDNSKKIVLKYEELLDSPTQVMGEVLQFLGVKNDSDSLREITSSIKPGRGFAFMSDEKLVDFYQSVKDTKLMTQLGYHQLK